MKFNRWITVVALLGAQTGFVLAEDQNDELQRLKQQIQELDRKVKQLEAKRDADEREGGAKSAPQLSVGAGGIGFNSADTNFVLKLRGYIQADSRWYTDDQIKGNDTFLLRRVRPVFEGTVFQNYEYKVMLDFGANTSSGGNNVANNGMLQDAYINVHYWDAAQLMLGKFKAPVGLERLQSARNLLFVERSLPTQLVPNRDMGVDLHGKILNGVLEYDVAALNGAGDGGSDDMEASDDGKDVAARLFATPFRSTRIEPLKKLGLGIAATIGNHEGTMRSYSTAGQQKFFNWRTGAGTATAPNVTSEGEEFRVVPQLSYYWGPFGVFAEYVLASQEVSGITGDAVSKGRFENNAWQVSASYVLTGEENSYDGISPKRPFSLSGGGWGAWEIAARVGQLSLDDTLFSPIFKGRKEAWAATGSAREANEWGVGLNWHLNKNVKVNVDYHRTQFEGGSNAKGAVTAHDEQVVMTRLQLVF